MGTLDPASEWLRLRDRYRQLTDDELIDLAQHSSELTEMAQGVLAQEISVRKLKLPPLEKTSSKPQPKPGGNKFEDEYAEDRKLAELTTVWSQRDALQLQNLLVDAGIPFFIGAEKATSVNEVTSSYSDGIPVSVMQIGLPWAMELMSSYAPEDEPPSLKGEGAEDEAIHCPRCHSDDVIFDQLKDEPLKDAGVSAPKFDWTCGACGYSWEDDGVESKR